MVCDHVSCALRGPARTFTSPGRLRRYAPYKGLHPLRRFAAIPAPSLERCRREAGVPFRRGRRDSREAAQGAQPLVRSVATQTARTFASPGRSLAERTIHGRRPCIEVRPSFRQGFSISQQNKLSKYMLHEFHSVSVNVIKNNAACIYR